jgi:hypothetical protein
MTVTDKDNFETCKCDSFMNCLSVWEPQTGMGDTSLALQQVQFE